VLAAGPLGVLLGFLAAATIGVGDVDRGPHGGCWRQVRQRPPPKLETSMAGPLGVLVAGPAAATTEVADVDVGPLGVLTVGPAAATTKVEDVVGRPPGLYAAICSEFCKKRCW
jgi:hypothetical protein